MAQKPKTRKYRIVSIATMALMVLFGFLEIARRHGNVRFLPSFQIAVGLMVIVSEIKGLLEEPN